MEPFGVKHPETKTTLKGRTYTTIDVTYEYEGGMWTLGSVAHVHTKPIFISQINNAELLTELSYS